MTQDLFRTDAYLAECTATVTAITDQGVVLDRTVFYPLGGGQAGDAGTLVLADGRALPISDTRKGKDAEGQFTNDICHVPAQDGHSSLSISYLPALTQVDYDHLLWACDLNFVRGEDSLVRALWAGRPFIWQIYPQDDGAHHAKLEAFLEWLDAPASLRRFHHAWNGLADPGGARWPGAPELDAWAACAHAARERLFTQDDLATQLLGFVGKKR